MALYGLSWPRLARLLDHSFWEYLYSDGNHPHRGMKLSEARKAGLLGRTVSESSPLQRSKKD